MNRRQMLSTVFVLPFLSQLRAPAPMPIVTADIIGTIRPQGPKYDIGAYEYIGTRAPVQPTKVRLIQ